jgi:hypothetical protein
MSELAPSDERGNARPNLLHHFGDSCDQSPGTLGGARPVHRARLFPQKFQCRHPLARNADRFAQVLLVARKDRDAMPPSGRGDVEKFTRHTVARDDDFINGFALALVGRDVADQLGHSLDVNQNVYTQSPVETRLVAVNQLEKSLQVM